MNSENIVTISLPNFITVGVMASLFTLTFGFIVMAASRAMNRG